jgi:hypothetical protein
MKYSDLGDLALRVQAAHINLIRRHHQQVPAEYLPKFLQFSGKKNQFEEIFFEDLCLTEIQ